MIQLPFYCSDDANLCGCVDGQVTEDSCRALSDAWFAEAHRLGLTYDADCELARLLAQPGPVSCEPEEQDQSIGCEDDCQTHYGDRGLGEACERAGRAMSTCAQDLACGVDGRCHAQCESPLEIAEGEPCGYAAGFLYEACGPGTLCSGEPATCVVPLARGGACGDTAGPPCGTDDRCDAATSTCSAKLTEGEPCSTNDECLSNACAGECQPARAFVCDHYIW